MLRKLNLRWFCSRKFQASIEEILYGYDDGGNLRSEQRRGVGFDKRDEGVRYYYDKADRLTGTVIEGVTTNYSYDKAGNMLSDGE